MAMVIAAAIEKLCNVEGRVARALQRICKRRSIAKFQRRMP
jgi:hypothetical protein